MMAGSINAGDTAWLLTSTLLVMLMTPGLALFYGGLVRGKNVVSTLMQSFFILALISVQWVLWGYSLAFGPDRAGLIGGLEWFALLGVGGEPLIKRVLGHSDGSVTAIYNRYGYVREMRAVLERWAAELTSEARSSARVRPKSGSLTRAETTTELRAEKAA